MGKNQPKQVLLRDLNGLLYLIPVDVLEQYKIQPDKLPEILEEIVKEIPEIDWRSRLEPGVKVAPVAAAKAVDVGISFAGGIAANKAVEKYNECCVMQCCVADCCVADCCVGDFKSNG